MEDILAGFNLFMPIMLLNRKCSAIMTTPQEKRHAHVINLKLQHATNEVRNVLIR